MHRACVKMTSRVGKHEISYIDVVDKGNSQSSGKKNLDPRLPLNRNVNAFKKMLKSSLLENYKFLKSEQF